MTIDNSIEYSPFEITARAEGYLENSSLMTINETKNITIYLHDITNPWSQLDELPQYTNKSSILINYVAFDNESTIAYINIYYSHNSDWILYVNGTGISHFNSSPILFSNISSDGEYQFYSIAYDYAGNYQLEPAIIVQTIIDTQIPLYNINLINEIDNASVNFYINILFNETMNITSINITLVPNEWTMIWYNNNTQLNVIPRNNLLYSTEYILTIIDGCDLAQNHLMPNSISYYTGPPPINIPELLSIQPENGSIIEPGPLTVTLFFSKNMDLNSVAYALTINNKNIINWSGNNNIFKIEMNIYPDINYQCILNTTAKNIEGNNISKQENWIYFCRQIVKQAMVVGYVINNDGYGIPNISVSILNITAITDQQGFFLLSFFNDGNYSIIVNETEIYKNTTINIEIDDGKDIEIIIRLEDRNGYLIGVICDSRHEPISNASIIITNGSWTSPRIYSGKNGEFNYELPHGKYSIIVIKNGYEKRTVDNILIKIGKTTDIHKILLYSINISTISTYQIILFILFCIIIIFIITKKFRLHK